MQASGESSPRSVSPRFGRSDLNWAKPEVGAIAIGIAHSAAISDDDSQRFANLTNGVEEDIFTVL